jgi:hypothetical protein
VNENENCDGKRNKYSVCQIKNGEEDKRLTCKRETKAYIKIQMYKSRTKEKERKEGRKKEKLKDE